MNEAVLPSIQLPPAVAEDLAQLEQRATRLSKRGSRWLTAAGVATVLAGVAMAVGFWVAPSASISSIDIPPVVLNAFSDAASVASAGGAGSPFESAASHLTGVLTGWFPKVALFLLLVIGGAVAAMTGDKKYFTMAGVLGFPVLAMPFVLGVMGEPGPVEQASPRDEFVAAVKRLDVDAMARALTNVDASDLNRTYILAQASLVQASKGGGTMPAAAHGAFVANVRLLDELSSNDPKARFLLDGQAVYALDLAALKVPSSEIGKAYLATSERHRATAIGVRDAFLAPALLAGCLGIGMVLLGRHLRERVARIKPLLGDTRAPDPAPVQEQRS